MPATAPITIPAIAPPPSPVCEESDAALEEGPAAVLEPVLEAEAKVDVVLMAAVDAALSVVLEDVAVDKNADFKLSASSSVVLAYGFANCVRQRLKASSSAIHVSYLALQHHFWVPSLLWQ